MQCHTVFLVYETLCMYMYCHADFLRCMIHVMSYRFLVHETLKLVFTYNYAYCADMLSHTALLVGYACEI